MINSVDNSNTVDNQKSPVIEALASFFASQGYVFNDDNCNKPGNRTATGIENLKHASF